MRLFVALTLPESVRQRLSGLANGLPGARWVKPENLHLTLRFLGEVDNVTAADVDDALAKIHSPGFDLSLNGIGHFGEGRKLRALWVGVDASAELMRLQEKIEQALIRAGLPPEARKFKPHVTLARFKSHPGARLQAYLAEHNLLRAGPIAVQSFELYSSFTSADGAIYRVEASYPLEPAEPPPAA
jgi:2'-5' RNA ligase